MSQYENNLEHENKKIRRKYILVLIPSIAAIIAALITGYCALVAAGVISWPFADSNSSSTSSESEDTATNSSVIPEPAISASDNDSFYAILCISTYALSDAENYAAELENYGEQAYILNTNEWDNLTDGYYSVTAGKYNTEEEAKAHLPHVKAFESEAYVKYSGNKISQ